MGQVLTLVVLQLKLLANQNKPLIYHVLFSFYLTANSESTVRSAVIAASDMTQQAVITIMAALHSRCGHFILGLLRSSFSLLSSPILSGRRLDVHHTSTHGVAVIVRI